MVCTLPRSGSLGIVQIAFYSVIFGFYFAFDIQKSSTKKEYPRTAWGRQALSEGIHDGRNRRRDVDDEIEPLLAQIKPIQKSA